MLRLRHLRPQPGAAVAALAASLPILVFANPARAQDDWTVDWKNGTRIESADGDFKIKIGGRIHADFGFVDEDDSLSTEGFEDGTQLRRARLTVSGSLYERVEFKLDYDLADGEVDAKDVYVGLTDLPGVGGLRMGHFKEPFALEEMTSSNHITFLERAMPVEAFAPVRNMGLMLHDKVAGDRMSWAIGAFKDADDLGTTLSSEWNLTGRLTGLVLDGSGDGPLLHLGLAASQRSPIDDRVRYRAKTQFTLSPRLVDTGTLMADGADLFAFETAFTQGPFWVAGEWMQASLDRPADADLDGFYVESGWFITGERRPFKVNQFDRLKPNTIFGKDGGTGAWEVALRYAEVDLNDGPVAGGAQDGFTAALNWYLNSATRLGLNYATTDVENQGTVNWVMLRLRLEF